MPTFLDFIERANTGPMMTEKDFNMKILIPAIRKLIKKYEITLDRENPVSADDAWQTGFSKPPWTCWRAPDFTVRTPTG